MNKSLNSIAKSLLLGLFVSSFVGFATSAQAYGPTLSAYLNGSNVTLTINGASPNSAVSLAYTQAGSSLPAIVTNFAITDNSGFYTTSVGSSAYGLSSGGQVYVTIGGQQSNVVTIGSGGGCTYNCGGSGSLTLSQTSLSLNVGQNATVTASYPVYGYSNSIYVSSNSNSSVATASVSGNTVTVYGSSSGTTNISICATGSGAACSTLYVTVSGGSYGNGNISFSPTSLSLTAGQNSTVSIYNNNGGYTYGSYYVSSNSNSAVASASLSGSSLYVNALTGGTTNITVCQNNYSSSCAILYVTVSGSGLTGSVWFSPSNPTLYVGQSLAVSISSAVGYGSTSYGSNSYYVSSNSNPSAVSASVTGTVLNLYANQSGSSSISVCSSSLSFCGTLYVTVGAGNSSLLLSQTSVSIAAGQTVSVTASNVPSIYISSNSAPSVVSASVNVNQINLYASTSGSSTVYVCGVNSSQCANIYVTVTGGSSSGSIYFTPSSLSIVAGQSATASIYNNSGYSYDNYYISSNSNSVIATASISGSGLYISALTNGNTNIIVCQSNYSSPCATLYVTVTGSVLGANTNLWFNPVNPNLNVGQSLAVAINSSVSPASSSSYSYGSNAYYVSSNSNSNVVTASITGIVLNLYGNQAGSSSISVCHISLGFCSTLYVTVGGGSGYGSGSVTLSQTNLTLSPGQSSTINIYGGNNYYVSSNTNSSVANPLISGNGLTVYGNQNGSTTITVCQNGNSGCANLFVTVSGYYYGGGSGGGLQYPGSGGGVLGASTYVSGQLISENGTVYIVYKNTKTGFVSASVFKALGFKFSNVTEVGSSGLQESGYAVRSALAQHPWGSWIKNRNTVYFVHETGLIPVASYNTFISNGGQDAWVVNANVADFRLPILSIMSVGDSRLQ